MKNQELREKLHGLLFTCGMNQRYHQKLQWRWSTADKAVRVTVGLLALLALFIPHESSFATPLAFVSLALAVTLNIVSFSEYERTYTSLFRAWSDLRRDTERLKARVSRRVPEANASTETFERYLEIKDQLNTLCAAESDPWRRLLRRCEEDENESIYGVRDPHSNIERLATAVLEVPVEADESAGDRV